MDLTLKSNQALIVVDLQNDFLPAGALAVGEGDRIIPIVNRLEKQFELVVATQDWHPATHGSFAENHPGKRTGEFIDLNGIHQILWPVHCVQGSFGAEFAKDFNLTRVQKIVRKGTDAAIDSYSGFFDNARRKETELGPYLKKAGVTEVFVVGLATDYCVKFTALDAVEMGFKTILVQDACRGVELSPGDVARALIEMKEKGVHIVKSDAI